MEGEREKNQISERQCCVKAQAGLVMTWGARPWVVGQAWELCSDGGAGVMF